jgi:hypothetical protein
MEKINETPRSRGRREKAERRGSAAQAPIHHAIVCDKKHHSSPHDFRFERFPLSVLLNKLSNSIEAVSGCAAMMIASP